MLEDRLRETLDTWRASGQLRTLPAPTLPSGTINFSSNDYLGLKTDRVFLDEFFAGLSPEDAQLSAASSRLLTGNCPAAERFEARLAACYHKEAALVFNCGYHANTGILPALATSKTLILADKLIHASLIDGIRLAQGKFIRYRHNDLVQLEELLTRHAAEYDTVFIVTESVFSMDGDFADLPQLVALKHRFPNVCLYLDEAHGVGVFGEHGLGVAEADHCLEEIDIFVGTLGKAFASNGAFVVCSATLRTYLVNTMRPFIFTTALPPICLAWSDFLFTRLDALAPRRATVQARAQQLHKALQPQSTTQRVSQIMPLILGETPKAIAAAQQLQAAGFYVLPIRPPTVPEGTSRLRFSVTAAMTEADVARLIESLRSYQS